MAGSGPSEDLDAIRRDANSPGDRALIREIRETGSRTARERIMDILDDGSLVEVDAYVKHISGDHVNYLLTLIQI